PGESMAGRACGGRLRELAMEDWRAREPVPVDLEACRAAIGGKVVLVTGAAGSIGSELTRRIIELAPAAIHLLDFNETALQGLRAELLRDLADTFPVKAWLCNITDRQKLDDVFEAIHPQVVFHLAAYNHVWMM